MRGSGSGVRRRSRRRRRSSSRRRRSNSRHTTAAIANNDNKNSKGNKTSKRNKDNEISTGDKDIKHSKNNNDRAFFSNAERRAAAFGRHSSAMLSGHNTGANFKEAGWGTDARQLDSDSMKEIDACSLSLQPCADPVVTPQGVLYDRMVVVQYILARKREIERATREWEAQQAGDAADAAGAAAQAAEARVEEFVARQEGLSAADLAQRQAARKGGGAGIPVKGFVV